MIRCEGYYPLENRRCDREATASAHVEGGEYEVCEYHRREGRSVARWSESTGRRLPHTPRLRRVA